MENDLLDDLPTQEVIFHTSLTESKRAPPISMMFTATNLFKEHGSMALSRKANADKNRLKAAWKSRGFYQMDLKNP